MYPRYKENPRLIPDSPLHIYEAGRESFPVDPGKVQYGNFFDDGIPIRRCHPVLPRLCTSDTLVLPDTGLVIKLTPLLQN